MTAADCWADRDALREGIARVIDPDAWNNIGWRRRAGYDTARDTARSLKKADSILKLIEAARHSQPGAEGGEGRDDFMGGCITGYVREAAKRVTGGNMTFADDDIRVLEVLAVRAVRAGLTDNLHPDVAATAVEACATHPLPDEASPQQPATSTDEKVGG